MSLLHFPKPAPFSGIELTPQCIHLLCDAYGSGGVVMCHLLVWGVQEAAPLHSLLGLIHPLFPKCG